MTYSLYEVRIFRRDAYFVYEKSDIEGHDHMVMYRRGRDGEWKKNSMSPILEGGVDASAECLYREFERYNKL